MAFFPCIQFACSNFRKEKTGKKVLAGPSEATAIGNLAAQMIADSVFTDAKEARKAIYNSFEIKKIQSR